MPSCDTLTSCDHPKQQQQQQQQLDEEDWEDFLEAYTCDQEKRNKYSILILPMLLVPIVGWAMLAVFCCRPKYRRDRLWYNRKMAVDEFNNRFRDHDVVMELQERPIPGKEYNDLYAVVTITNVGQPVPDVELVKLDKKKQKALRDLMSGQ